MSVRVVGSRCSAAQARIDGRERQADRRRELAEQIDQVVGELLEKAQAKDLEDRRDRTEQRHRLVISASPAMFVAVVAEVTAKTSRQVPL